MKLVIHNNFFDWAQPNLMKSLDNEAVDSGVFDLFCSAFSNQVHHRFKETQVMVRTAAVTSLVMRWELVFKEKQNSSPMERSSIHPNCQKQSVTCPSGC
mgnify:CR=1 FL=1